MWGNRPSIEGCPSRREHALFLEDIVEEVQRDQQTNDDETDIDETVDPI